MKNKWTLIGSLLAVALLALAVGPGQAQGPEPPGQGTEPQGEVGIQAAVGTAFTYQGQLKSGSNPVNGNCDFQFKLYNAATNGTQVGSTQTKTNVSVSNGLFTTSLDFGSAFTGDARWLAIAVRCPAGSGSYTTLSPRQALTAAPYALGLRPGAAIVGQEGDYSALSVSNGYPGGVWPPYEKKAIAAWTSDGTALWGAAGSGTGVYGDSDNVGVYGRSGGTAGRGVYGKATATSGTTYGVYGESASTGGRGVYGYASATSGFNYGVRGKSNSTNGHGVYGEAPTRGVVGYATATSGYTYGVLGHSASTDGHGVYGSATATSGTTYGVYGESTSTAGVGVYGWAHAASGTNYGVYGESNSTDGYGGYFVNSSTDGIALYANGSGSGRYKTTLRVNNTEASGGMAAYFTNSSNFHTAHFYNASTGGVLYLQNGGTDAGGTSGGDFISAVNGPETDTQFRVLTSGEVRSDVGFNTPAADLAEMLPAADGLEPGDVLVVGADGKLARSTQPYQPTVVGVYSTQPGFVGGQPVEGELEGHIPLAVVGVVPVKVSAENGPIRPGDLLVASSTPGHAMRADHFVGGAVIGKALEGLEEGTGVIRMLVVLQ